MDELTDDPLAQAIKQCRERLQQHFDGNIIIYGGGSRRRFWQHMVAIGLLNDIPLIKPGVLTVDKARQDLLASIEELRVQFDQFSSKARISAEDLMGIANAQPHASRRGRNIKPDKSRKARYSTPRSRQ